MAKISAYPDGGALQDSDDIVVRRGNQNFKILGSNISSGGGSSLTNASISPTIADITLSANTRYFVDASGLTADRALKFPAGSDGDQIEIRIIDQHASYACVLQGDTGVDLEGLTATEWDRLWNSGMSIAFVYLTGDGWRRTWDARKFWRKYTLSGSAQFDFQNIPAIYNNMLIKLSGRGTDVGTDDALLARFNNDSGANYSRLTAFWFHNTQYGTVEALAQTSARAGAIPAAGATANFFGTAEIYINGYSDTNKIKTCQSRTVRRKNTASQSMAVFDEAWDWSSTNAINRVTLYGSAAANLAQYSEAIMYLS